MKTPAVIIPDTQDMPKKELKTPKEQSYAEKYRAAFEKVFLTLPAWKQAVILSKNYDDRIYNEFVKEVVIEVEHQK